MILSFSIKVREGTPRTSVAMGHKIYINKEGIINSRKYAICEKEV